MLEDFALAARDGVFIGDVHDFEQRRQAVFQQQRGTAFTQAAIDAVFLDGDDRARVCRYREQRGFVERLTTLLKGTAHYLPVPGVTSSKDTRATLLNDPYTHQAVEMFDQLTLALVGIGTVEPSLLLSRSGNVFSLKELELLRQANAVGDICLRFFDAEGKAVQTSLNERVTGIAPAQLKQVKRSVGIAGGHRKRIAIRAAVVGRWINVLITDRTTAQFLLENEA